MAEIDPYEKEQLCDTLKEEEFAANSYIVNQGEQGDRFYIIAEGKLIAEKKEDGSTVCKKVFEYKEGDYFGEIALVKNTVRQASIKAETDCRVVSIDRDAFKRLLGPMEDILQRNMDKYKKYLMQWSTTLSLSTYQIHYKKDVPKYRSYLSSLIDDIVRMHL